MLRRFYLGLLAIVVVAIVIAISRVEAWVWYNWLFLAILMLDYKKDQREIDWSQFLPKGILLLGIPYLVYKYAPAFWYMVAKWEFHNVHHLWNWNGVFRKIPFNNGAIFRVYHPEWLTAFLRWVYRYGFALALWVAVIRSFLAKDGRKMLRYVLSGHTLQLPLIIPFYMTIMLQEVWYVSGDPDGMARNFTPEQADYYTQNCFPSMHTSISVAVLLLALREKGKLFKWTMVTYCSLIVYSTLYLEIHWVLDVIGGIILGYVTVKLSDLLLGKIWPEAEQVSGKSAPVVLQSKPQTQQMPS
ncbi:PAP2 family phosphoesterase [Collibacillus ludicampi]|jgi:membrane-associated phospholipid phosphatase|uniref:PAP2 family phosphoesterase n=1 Tax=Collibacillus ludicampi TaxID=2771369 RepID=A0AAV4LHX3_9BACL|nr:phosphatase PAP2 family protein [Collibacillus ludicampi]GIM47410.1 PAP2 family phosphoesterase [Collibacillus ludicampi]